VLHQIGIGALGPVFRTYEPTRDRLVAVKVFRLDIVPEQTQALATALGRATSASLLHPSIVEPIAAGVEGTLAYRAEEYVAAESLDVAMRHYAPAPIDKVLPFITQLAGAIDFARAAGVGHGGLHPRDIFVTPDDARATGFGVIEALEEVGIRAPVRRPYTAPERIDGKNWGTPADVFSLAAITFELLTGRRPAGTGALIGALPGGDAASALHAVLARAMHDEPSERYASALAFAAALETASRGQAEPAPAASAPVATQPVPVPPGLTVERKSEPEPEPAVERRQPEPATDHLGSARYEKGEAIAAAAKAEPEPQPELQPEAELEPEPEPAPARVKRIRPREPLLFDAARDDRPVDRFADDFAVDEGLLAHHAPEPPKRLEPEPPVPAEPLERREPEEPLMFEQPDSGRPAVLPTAIGVVLGLLAGFAGGYFVGSRDRLTPQTASASTSASTAATRDQPGQYSEQKVNPPATPGPTAAAPTEPKATEPPPVVQETEPTRGAAPRAAAPPPAPPAARERTKSTGSIVVKSTPSRAGVTVNGKWRGRTPLTLDRLAFGHYVVRIVQPGYRVAQEEFALAARDPDHTFTAKLEAAATAAKREPAAPKTAPTSATGNFGTLYVDSRPRGATVLLDGRNIGVTPVSVGEVAIGSHVIRVELAGKRTWTSTTTVAAGQTARVTMSLEDK
jgi:hypothetical protein